MIRLAPAARLSIGLVILVISILLLAQTLGLTNSDKELYENRKQVAETLSAQITLALARGDEQLLKDMLNSTQDRMPDLQSAAVRNNTGEIFIQTKDHEKFWQGADPQKSTPTHIRLPIIMNQIKRADVEMSFKPLGKAKLPVLHLPRFAVLIIFVSLSGFLGFWLYIRRVLKHLDPSAVVPARVRNALNILSEGVLILDRREQIVLANASMLEKLERSEESLIGKKASALSWQLDTNQEAKIYPWLQAQETGIKQAGIRLILQKENQPKKTFRVNAVPILDPKGASQGTIAVFDDISELEEKTLMLEDMIKELAQSRASIELQNKKLTQLATRDPLTNCYNRRALYEYLEGTSGGSRKTDQDYACIMADIDHFKRVNDTYGHGLGDDVIKMMANTIREVVREQDIVARMGGEEFCVILPGATLEVAHAIAERCREKIWSKTTGGVKVTSSFGVTSSKLGGKDPQEIIHQADEALYASKESGRNRVTSWSEEIESKGIK